MRWADQRDGFMQNAGGRLVRSSIEPRIRNGELHYLELMFGARGVMIADFVDASQTKLLGQRPLCHSRGIARHTAERS